MTDRFMTLTPMEGGFYPIGEFFEDGKKWYLVANGEGKYNIANSEGRILCNKDFFQYITHSGRFFNDGYATITTLNGLNFMDKNGDLVIKDDSINVISSAVFVDGVIKVTLSNGKRNFLTTEGKLILPENHTYDNVLVFKNGFGIVSKDKKVNFVNSSGKLISEVWFQDTVGFNDYGYACCLIEGKGWNVINTEGKMILGRYYKSIGTAGNIIIATDNDYLYLFLCHSGEVHCIETVLPDYHEINIDKENECIILKDTNFLEPKVKVFLYSGETVFDEWVFEDIEPIRITTSQMIKELFFLVKKRNSKGRLVCTIMDKNGKYAFTKKWFQQFDGEFKFEQEYTDYVTVMYNGKWYKLNFDGKNSLIPIKKGYAKEDAYLYLIED